ncbi:Ig-like domain-containing protein, partial [Acinetobacter tianfuensis]
MTQISVISKESHQVLEQVDANRVGLTQNSVVVIKVPKEDVASITKDGNNAVITLKSGETIVIENYFANENSDNSLVFEGEDGGLFWAKFTDANGAIADVIQYQPLENVEPLLYKDSLVGVILPWALGAAGAGAVGAALNNDDKDTQNPPAAVNKLGTPVLMDNQEPQIGKVENGGSTNDKTPALSGTGAEPGAVIKVYDGDKVIAQTTAKPDGTWTVEVPELAEGAHSISATQTVNGQEGPKSDAINFTVDTTDPTLSIDDLKDTNDTTPTITGKTNEPNSDISVVIRDKNGDIVDSGKGAVDGSGNWTYTPSKPLPEGEYTVEATAKDPAGNDTSVSKGGLTVDTTPPDVTIDPLAPTGNDKPVIGGTTDPDAVIDVVIKDKDGAVVDSGKGTVDGNGDWTYTPSKPLPEGEYTVDVTAKDPAGNDTAKTETGLEVDKTLPAISIDPLKPTNDDTPALTGKTDPDSSVKVEIKDGLGNVVDSGNAAVDGNGNWTYTPSKPLPEGSYKVEATATDPAGNTGKATDFGLSVDTSAPVISIDPLAPTNDSTPDVAGKTEAGASVKVEIKDASGKVVETGNAAVSPSGDWSYTPKNPLTDGSYSVTATATDPAGNQGTANGSGLIVDVSGLSIAINPLQPTKDTTPDVSGKTSAGVSVAVVIKDQTGKVVDTGTVTADSSGNWSYTASKVLPEGAYTVDATATNAAGTKANATASGLIIDTTLPAVTVDALALTNDATPAVKGTTEKGAAVEVEIKDAAGKVVDTGAATVDANGSWTYTPSANLPDGSYTVEATAKDAAGNEATAAGNGLTVDTTPPTVTIEPLALTNVVEPVIKGSAEVGATVTVEVTDSQGNVVASGTAQVDGNGEWSFKPTSPLTNGSYTVNATAKDAAGNPATVTDSGLEIDTVPPTVDIDDLFGAGSARMLMSTASTTSSTLPQTNQVKPTFSGTSTKSSEVMIYLQDESGKTVDSGLAKLDPATGRWTFTPSSDLAEGYYMLQAISKDAAGNQSAPAAKAFIVDIQAPVVEVEDVGLTNDATPEVKGKVNEPTATVTVKVKNAAGKVIETGTATVASDGKWSYTVKAALPDGSYQVTASARDKAGNVGAEDTGTAQVDTSAPTSTLTVSPTGEIVITFSEAVKDFDKSDVKVQGGTLIGLTQQSDGSWKGQVVADGTTGATGKVDITIADGSYKDTAGNAGKGSSVTGADVPSVDTTAPAAAITVDAAGNVTITFSEPVKGFDALDVKVSGGKLENLTQQSDGSWTGTVTANGATGVPGKVDLTIPAGSYTDLADNPGTAATATQTVPSVDSTGPTPTLTLDANGNLVIKFNEPVKGFDASDVKVTGGIVSGLAEQPDGSWTGKVVAENTTGAAGLVVVYIDKDTYTDLAGNNGSGGFVSQTVQGTDLTAPTAQITLDANGNVVIKFSEKVTGFEQADLTVANAALSNFVKQSDDTWTAKVTPIGNTGAPVDVTVSLAQDSYTDLAGNKGAAAAVTEKLTTVDTQPPAIDNFDVKPNTDGTATVTGKTEPGATVTVKDPSGNTVPVTVNPDGSFTATVPAPAPEGTYTATATDKAGNPATA